MSEFFTDFGTFLQIIFSEVVLLFNWFISTLVGEIILFTIIIALFWYFIKLFITIKD